MSDPICGNCGNPLSKHFDEDEMFCNETTNGDVFTSTPVDSILLDYIREKSVVFYNQLVKDWKRDNGHGTWEE